MRIGIVGAGAIGGTMAALLDRAGHHVSVAARGDQLRAIRADGIRLEGVWGQHVAKVHASHSLSALPFAERPDLAIVATKAQDALEAIEANHAVLGATRVLVVQNGVDGVQAARRALRGAPVVGGLALFAAEFVRTGVVAVTAPGTTYLGDGDVEPGHDVLAVSEALAAVLPVEITGNFAGCQWTKLVVNELNALPAITGMSVQQTVDDAELRVVVTAAMRETVRAAHAAGIRFGALQGLDDRRLRAFARAPMALATRLPRRMTAVMGETPNQGSTLQSIRRGRPTEIDHLSGAVVEAGRSAGFATPVNALLVQLVHDVERTGRFFNSTEVQSRFAGATMR